MSWFCTWCWFFVSVFVNVLVLMKVIFCIMKQICQRSDRRLQVEPGAIAVLANLILPVTFLRKPHSLGKPLNRWTAPNGFGLRCKNGILIPGNGSLWKYRSCWRSFILSARIRDRGNFVEIVYCAMSFPYASGVVCHDGCADIKISLSDHQSFGS